MQKISTICIYKSKNKIDIIIKVLIIKDDLKLIIVEGSETDTDF